MFFLTHPFFTSLCIYNIIGCAICQCFFCKLYKNIPKLLKDIFMQTSVRFTLSDACLKEFFVYLYTFVILNYNTEKPPKPPFCKIFLFFSKNLSCFCLQLLSVYFVFLVILFIWCATCIQVKSSM